jgi:hypothetical protein
MLSSATVSLERLQYSEGGLSPGTVNRDRYNEIQPIQSVLKSVPR